MHPRLLLPVALAVGCAPTSTQPPAKPAAAEALPQAPAGRDVARGESPWTAEDRRIPPGKERFSGELFAELPFATRSGAPRRLSRDALGYLDMPHGHYMGPRVLATRERVHRIDEPNELTSFCVARDGRTTFAVERGGKLLTAPSFDAPMRHVGRVEQDVSGSYITVEEDKRSFVDCRRGTIEDMSKIRGYPRVQHHSDAATLLSFYEEHRRVCRVRGGSETAWEELPRCLSAALYEDQLVRVMVETPDGQSTKCAVAFDVEGKRRPCGKDAAYFRGAPAESPIDFRLARFVTQSLIAVVDDKGISILPASGSRSDLRPIAQGRCSPIVAVSPLFRCFSDEQKIARIVSIDTNGKARDELSLPIRVGHEMRFFETAGGALATGGGCDASPGDKACVRQPSGEWKTIAFAPDLVKALHTTAPGTLVLPTVSGELFVGTGVSEGSYDIGPVELLVYKGDAGLVTKVGRLPKWIAGDSGGSAGLASIFIGAGGYRNNGPTLLWRSATTFSAWPLERSHPAFRTPETCRFDVSLSGSTNVSCVPGNTHAVGRFGMIEKKPGELLETYDGGETWSQVPLPIGVDTSDVDCAAIGCRIGPYFRLGWGL